VAANDPPPSRRLCAVTGAGGFIGSHLVEALLDAGEQVHALVHYNALGSHGHLAEVARTHPRARNLSVFLGDVTDCHWLREFVDGVDVVFHLAALIAIPYSYMAPSSYVQANVVGTLNVLEACREAGVERLVHTSTSEVLGSALYTPQDEDHPLQAQSPYAASKVAADKLVESYHHSYDFPAVTVRPFNTYGPRQSMRAVLPTILAQALSPKCAEIRLGSLDPVRDLTFASDTAAGFVAASLAPLEDVSGRLFHLGVGEGVTIGELARRALAVVGCDKPIVCESTRVRPRKSEVRALVSNNARAREALGWEPRVGLDEGLARTAEYIAANLERYRPADYAR
jgi:NAD dependent epimerase/dehydratase